MATKPTSEEIAAARALVAQADAAQAARSRQDTLALIAPFIDAGWGAEAENSPIRVAAKALRDNALALSAIGDDLPSTFFTAAKIMGTVDDKIRSLAAMNAEPAT